MPTTKKTAAAPVGADAGTANQGTDAEVISPAPSDELARLDDALGTPPGGGVDAAIEQMQSVQRLAAYLGVLPEQAVNDAIDQISDANENEDAAGQLARISTFLDTSYPGERKSNEDLADVVLRLLDRARAVPPAGVDPATGQPYAAPLSDAGTSYANTTVTVDDVDMAAIADRLSVDATQLLALNIVTLDQEAIARGLGNSDNGRILFTGTVLRIPA